jgi:hypothetical protein
MIEPSSWCRLPMDVDDPAAFHSQAHFEQYHRAARAVAERAALADRLAALDELVEAHQLEGLAA